jgi:hypothetical protein
MLSGILITASAVSGEIKVKTERKRLTPGQRVSGSVGALMPNPDVHKKRSLLKKICGNFIGETATKKYRVQFDDG